MLKGHADPDDSRDAELARDDGRVRIRPRTTTVSPCDQTPSLMLSTRMPDAIARSTSARYSSVPLKTRPPAECGRQRASSAAQRKIPGSPSRS